MNMKYSHTSSGAPDQSGSFKLFSTIKLHLECNSCSLVLDTIKMRTIGLLLVTLTSASLGQALMMSQFSTMRVQESKWSPAMFKKLPAR